jgi:hypothetical protein
MQVSQQMDNYSTASFDATTSLESPSPTTSSAAPTCEQCGKPFAKRQGSGGSPQRFCSAQCRQASHTNGQHSQRSPACDAATEPPATPIAQPAKATQQAPEAGQERFDWSEDDSIIVEEQLPVAVYINERDQLIIRQHTWPDEDAVIVIAPQNIEQFIDRLVDIVGIPNVGRG